MNEECSIARDLMPQVIDQVASPESRAFVERHTAGCEPCAQVYADMLGEPQPAQNGGSAAEALSFKAAVSSLRKTLGWKRLRTALLATALTLALVIAGYAGYTYLFESPYHRAMPMDAYEVNLYQGSDGTIYGATHFLKNYAGSGPDIEVTENGEIVYLFWYCAIIPVEKERLPQPNPQYGVRLSMTADGALTLGDGTAIREIRQGTPSDYVVVYRAGDAIPPLDPATDEYLRMEEAYFEQIDEAQQMDFDAQTEFQVYTEQWERDHGAQATATPVAP
jgi:hypothetical protein